MLAGDHDSYNFVNGRKSYAISAAVILAFLRREEELNSRDESVHRRDGVTEEEMKPARHTPRPTDWRTAAARPAWRVATARITLIFTHTREGEEKIKE